MLIAHHGLASKEKHSSAQSHCYSVDKRGVLWARLSKTGLGVLRNGSVPSLRSHTYQIVFVPNRSREASKATRQQPPTHPRRTRRFTC
jgi:hypothetical protein